MCNGGYENIRELNPIPPSSHSLRTPRQVKIQLCYEYKTKVDSNEVQVVCEDEK